MRKLLAIAAAPAVVTLLAVPARADDIDWNNLGQYSADAYGPMVDQPTFTEVVEDDSLEWGSGDPYWAANASGWYLVWPSGCKTARATIQRYYYSLWVKVVTTSFTVSQYFCYSDGNITYAPAAEAWGSTTFAGSAQGWTYNGVTSPEDFFYPYLGHDQGGHDAFRVGMFTDCLARFACLGGDYEAIDLYVHGDGTHNAYQR